MIERLMIIWWAIKDWWRGDFLGGLRSNQWGKVRAEFLKKNPQCAVCGRKSTLLKPLNVHHKILFSADPSQELNPENLIVLCPEHHLLFGHLMNFKIGNPNVERDAKEWREKIANRSLSPELLKKD